MPDESTLKASFVAGLFVVISLVVGWYFKVDPLVSPLHSPRLNLAALDEHTCPQLNAIPTIGFSDRILSYFTALKMIFDRGHMIKEGYEKVGYLLANHIHFSLYGAEDVPFLRQDQVYSKLRL